MINVEVGAFPFIRIKGKLMVMIVTNCSGNTWILPKGQQEENMRDGKVAVMEAFEEAGVKGNLVFSRRYKEFKRKDGGVLKVYPLGIRKVLSKWPEKSIRKRELVSIREALSRVTRKEHINAILHFSKPERLKELAKQRFST